MVQEAAERVAEYAHDRCGSGLRTVAYLADDEWTCVYLRDDLQDTYTEETYAEAVERFRTDHVEPPVETDSLPVGRRHSVVYHHDNAFIIRLFVGAGENILVSVDPDTGRSLLMFIDECRQLATGEE
jgi:hypothetical protein